MTEIHSHHFSTSFSATMFVSTVPCQSVDANITDPQADCEMLHITDYRYGQDYYSTRQTRHYARDYKVQQSCHPNPSPMVYIIHLLQWPQMPKLSQMLHFDLVYPR